MLIRRASVLGMVAILAVAAPVLAQDRATPVRVNGVLLHVLARTVVGAPDELARQLRGRWGERLSAPGEAPAQRQILGRQRGAFHETLTLSPGPRSGTARLVVAVQDLREVPARLPSPPLSLPRAARVVNVVQFGAAPAAPAAFTVEVPGASAPTLERLWHAAAARGWQRINAPVPLGLPGAALWARRGAVEVAVVALPVRGGSRLVMVVGGEAAQVSR